MKYKIKKILYFTILLIFISLILSFDIESSLEVDIKFDSEQIYFLNSPIDVKFEKINKTAQNYYFEVAEDIIFSVDFKIYTSAGEEVPYSKQYILTKSTREKVYTRTILIAPFQSVSYIINISEWYDFQTSGLYFIQGIFYPSIERDSQIISKNVLKLELNPPKTFFPSATTAEKYVEAKKVQQNIRDLPPYKIVEMALQARIDRNWDLYFSFFDFDSYIIQYTKYKTKYLYASEQDRLKIIEDFKKERISEFYNDLIHYEIKKTVIEKDKAVVNVYLEFKYKDIIERYDSEFYLVLKNQTWLIYGYILVPIHNK